MATRPVRLRLAMALVGLCLLALAVALVGATVLLVGELLALGLDPVGIALAVGVGSLLAGLASYAIGAEQLLSTVDARPLDPARAPVAARTLSDVAAAMDVPEPELLIGHLGEPNAFSVRGPRRSAIVVDRSLFGLLDRAELEAVLAHELAHLESADAIVQTLAFGVVRVLVTFLTLLVLPLLLVATTLAAAVAWLRGRPETWHLTAPGRLRAGIEGFVVGVLVVLTIAIRAHSRRREYAADRRAATVTGRPLALADALRKIERATRAAHGPLATLYVPDEDGDPLADLFATHPDTEGRVKRLRELAGERTIPIRTSE